MSLNDPAITGTLEQRPDCPGPELMASYIDGRKLWWGRRRRLEAHFADCDRCFTLLRDIMDFRDSERDARDTVPHGSRFAVLPFRSRSPRLAWLSAGGFGAVAAALLVIFVLRGPADPGLAPLIDALGTQRVTDARLTGFAYGPRPEVMRSASPATSGPSISLDARAAAAAIQETAGTSTTAGARHTVGVSRLISGDLDTAITDLQHAVSTEPGNATYLSDLAAAYLTRGIRQQNPADIQQALARADEALTRDARHLSALFNRALALESLERRDAARAAWEDYLKVDGSSDWAAEARQHLSS
jgi:hypothetical protein